MNRYKTLFSNTLLFGLATFSSKILTFAMLPIVTDIIIDEQMGIYDLVYGTCLFLVPVISLCVHEAVIRFGLDERERKSDVFTTAVLTILTGLVVLLLFYPLLGFIPAVGGYRVYMYLFVLCSALRSTVTHFVRASGFTRLFALDGIMTTALTVGFVILFVVHLRLGIEGYLAATILADALSGFGLIFLLRLYRFFRPRTLKKSTLRGMLRYSILLVPATIFWWVTNLSDRYMVKAFCGDAANGVYGIAYKIPTMITLVSTIFIQAWQISAFSEANEEERTRFYTNVFSGYCTLVFVAASGLILLIKPITRILVAEGYYESWRYVPFLVLSVAFACLVTYLGTIYNVAKNNTMSTLTALVGAVVNVGLNLVLIPIHGPIGAAFATFASYLIVFVIRAVDTRRYIAIDMRPSRIAISLALLLLQSWGVLKEISWWVPVELLVLAALVLCNIGPVLYVLRGLRRSAR